ncbi:50S ribosomal protein L21 [Candidatus Zinderia endosymbiont of Aphrophora alni]|uniref:50S ribosomal protein L21 n=1 Tax=Candidatus Zinderia endosymbiont of Aphrophora alni TaxID=3077951 RepID=UPI0030CEE6AE
MKNILYAIIEIKGKQYKIKVNDIIKIDIIKANIGDIIYIKKILIIKTINKINIGTPIIKNYIIISKIIKKKKYKKIKIFKMRRRKHYQKHQGFRKKYFELKIQSISKID